MHVSTLFEAGGLGAVLETDGYETCECFRDHYCAIDAEDWCVARMASFGRLHVQA